MVQSKDNFQTKSTKTPAGNLKQSYSVTLELSILGSRLNAHKKWNMIDKFQAVRAQLLGLV